MRFLHGWFLCHLSPYRWMEGSDPAMADPHRNPASGCPPGDFSSVPVGLEGSLLGLSSLHIDQRSGHQRPPLSPWRHWDCATYLASLDRLRYHRWAYSNLAKPSWNGRTVVQLSPV